MQERVYNNVCPAKKNEPIVIDLESESDNE